MILKNQGDVLITNCFMCVYWTLSSGGYSDYQGGVNSSSCGQWRCKSQSAQPQHSTAKGDQHTRPQVAQPVRGIHLADGFCCLLQEGYRKWSQAPGAAPDTHLYLWKSPCLRPCCCCDSFTICRTATHVKAHSQCSWHQLLLPPQNNRREPHRSH